MSHPQPPTGPQDPHQPHPEQASDPWAPPPTPGGTPQDGTWAPPPQPDPGSPWSAPQPPGTPPADPYQPGGAYPPSGPYPPAGPYPPGGAGYPPGAPPPTGVGYPPGPPPPVPTGGSGGRTVLIVVIAVVVVALLCCVGGVVALVAGLNRTAEQISEALPTPSVTYPVPEPSRTPTEASPPRPAGEGETFNMRAGDTLVLNDDDGTLEITVTRFRTVTEGCRAFAPKPTKGRYLIAEVTATVTEGTSSINPFYFEWVGDDGATVNGLIGALSGCGEPLGSGNGLRAGSKRAGTVVFDVADTSGVVEYRHRFETAGSWKP
ncbi:DUF4352 domain-containing protein [Micromonospora radicis]|uniref:DUF4352 domain-containing protein n=1 Tax=Micromonospora radicis TaxID=1894971 RepID=A0A418MX11_9ACTN|nr:hypothetical protein [Micromonospora radicis]RIV39367.1 hypothetical protein D2L64_08550 [Micromonospora radicis]